MTVKEWYENTDLQTEWRKTWNKPHMRAGLLVLKDLAVLLSYADSAGTEDATIRNAHQNKFREGAMGLLGTIKTLGEEKTPLADAPDPWSHAITKLENELKERTQP